MTRCSPTRRRSRSSGDVGNENLQAFCLNGIGNVYLAKR